MKLINWKNPYLNVQLGERRPHTRTAVKKSVCVEVIHTIIVSFLNPNFVLFPTFEDNSKEKPSGTLSGGFR